MKKNYTCGTPLWRCLKKAAKAMNVRVMLIFVCLIHFSVLYSQNNNGFTMELKDVPLEKVFDQIKAQSDYTFFYDNEGISKIKNVSIDVKNASIDEVMAQVLKATPYAYKIVDKTIVLYLKEKKEQPGNSRSNNAYTVSGKVVDEQNLPLPGATVLIKGTTKGTTTNVNGNYAIKVPQGSVLVFSFVGFHKQEVSVSAENPEINVMMEQSAAELEEFTVISTGYQLIKPEQSTGSIATMRAKEYDSRINTSDFLTGLTNRIPGLLINNDIEFEDNSLFQIRGISTINGEKEPLIVVDGFPTELSIDMINPNEIESVTVLKDAAAATVYGARSSNGVIIIERKKAKAGDPRVNFRATAGFTPKENYDRYRWDEDASNTYLNYYRSYYEDKIYSYEWNYITSSTWGGSFPYCSLYTILAQQAASVITAEDVDEQFAELGSYNNTDDYSRLFERTAVTQTYNLDVSGGSDKLLYYLTASYTDHSASEIKTDNSSFKLSGRATMKFSNRFSLDLTTDFQDSKTNSVPIPGINNVYPYEAFEDEDGNPLAIFNGSYANTYYNDNLISMGLLDNLYYPLVDIEEINTKTRTTNNRITANFRYDIGKGFNLSFGGVYELSRLDTKYLASENSSVVHQYVNRYAEDDGYGGFVFNIPQGDFLKQSKATTESYTLRAQLNYDKQINKDHSLNLIFGGEIRDVLDKSNTASYFGYNDQTLMHQAVDYTLLSPSFYPSYATSNPSLTYDDLFSQEYEDNRYISLYSNVVYSYKGKYSATGSIRIDQSNLFGTDPKYKYKPLWSVGAAWNIHKENFMQDIEWVKSLKLRMSYGFNGNVAKNALPEVIAESGTNYINSEYISMLDILSYANSGLRWEQTCNFNVGLDYSIFKNIEGSIDYYIKKSTDVLATSQIDATKGGSYATVNQASIRNSGLEITLHADWITRKNFNWNTGLVFSHNSSKVLKVYNDIQAASTTYALYYLYSSYCNYLEGYPIGSLFNYNYAGLNSDGEILVYNENGEAEEFSYYADNSYVHNSGNSIPTYNIGLSNRVDIGNFYVYCMFNFYGGFKVRVPVPDASDTRPLEGANNYWKEAGDEADPDVLPSIFDQYGSYLAYTDKYTVNGAYLTLGDLTAAYSFRDSKWVKKAGLTNFEVRLQAHNVYTVAFNKYNYSVATGSYAKSYLTPTYTVGLYVNF